jgi:hypothetical protein
MIRSTDGRKAVSVTALVMAAGLALAGCSDARKALGWDKNPPDEFKIVNRAPLSQPPNYALRPPQPGAPRPQETSTQDRVRQSVIGANGNPAGGAQTASAASAGESALLARIGTSRVDPRIREVVDSEAQSAVEADRTLVDRIIFWRKPEEPGTVIDPQKESQRLRENAALGRPATEGDTPTIQRRERGIF